MTRKRKSDDDGDEPPVGREVPDTAFPDEGLTANVEKPVDRLRPHEGADEDATDEGS